MTARSLLQTSFNGGELSARMEGRPDLQAYGIAARRMPNMLVTVQGPAVKRSGTRHVAFAKSGTLDAELIPFRYNITQGYVIEAGHQYFRFNTNDAQILAAGLPYEIATPFQTADLPNIDWAQSFDALYLVDGAHQPQKLTRTGAATFAIGGLDLKNGPFKDQNGDDAHTVQASAGTGSVTLTASAATWSAGHVGGLMEIEAADFRSIPAWEPSVDAEVDDKRRSEGKVYRAAAMPASGSERTGTERPIHTEGQQRDGSSVGKDYNDNDVGGVLWEYLYSRAGIVRITAFVSATEVVATVLKRLPDEVVAAATPLWALGAFSNAEGWPSAVELRDERLWLAKGNELFGGVAGDLENFSSRDDSGLPQPDLAIRRKLPTPDMIRWLANDRALLVGTNEREFAVQAVNPALAVAYNNVGTPKQSQHGSERVKPVQVGGGTLFVSRGGRKLRVADYAFDRDRYVSPDATVRSEHITLSGIRRLATTMEPESLVWAARNDGALVCLTWSEEQDVRALTPHHLAGPGAHVHSIASIPAPDGSHDQLWLLVRRMIGGVPVRSVERLLPMWQEGQDPMTGCFLDCSLTYEGAPATVIAGLTHLAGETVSVLADGATHPDLVVSGAGAITLNRPASTVHVGYLFLASVEPMRLAPEAPTGSGLSKLKRVHKLGLGLQESLGLRVRRPGGRNELVEFRKSSMAMDAAVPLFTGEHIAGFPGGWDREARVVVESFQPLPFTLNSISARAAMGEEE